MGVPSQPLKRDADEMHETTDVPTKVQKTSDMKTEDNATKAEDNVTKMEDNAIAEDLVYVLNEAEIHAKNQNILKEMGITTVANVLERSNDFKDGKVGSLRTAVQNRIHQFCLWFNEFHKKHDGDKNWKDDFNGDRFEAFIEEAKHAAEQTVDVGAMAHQAIKTIHDGASSTLRKLVAENKLSEQTLEQLYGIFASRVTQRLPSGLVKMCQFDVQALIATCIRAIFNLPTGNPYPKILLVAGQTQSGKSNVKAVVQATCDVLDCPLFIITKGVAESKDLSKKLDYLLNQDNGSLNDWLQASQQKRSNIIPDTAARIKRAIQTVEQLREKKPSAKVCMIVDECDAMYRTDERSQQMEQAYDKLMMLGPALRIEISATPIPALLYLQGELEHDVEMVELGTSADYAGITEMVPLKDDDGNTLSLEVASTDEKKDFKIGIKYDRSTKLDLKKFDNDVLFPEEENKDKPFEFQAKNFSKSEKLKTIPCTDSNVMRLYSTAMAEAGLDSAKQQGVHLLDCTNNRVRADDNIFQKAACVQNHFARQSKEMVIICVVGDGIYFRRPGFVHGRKVTNRKTVSAVIHRLNAEFGLSMPFFVFGFSKMKRCISYRSDTRVPTHMVINLGLGQSNESFIQALGRATFNGLETVLAKNGFSHVTVLTSERDLKMAQRYTKFVHEVSERLRAGKMTVEDVLKDGKEKFKDGSNYLRFSNRKTGQMKSLKSHLPDQDNHFEDPDDDDFVNQTPGSDLTVEHVKMSIFNLVREIASKEAEDEFAATGVRNTDNKDHDELLKTTNAKGFTAKQIKDMYNDTFQEDGHSIKAGELNRQLTKLKTQSRVTRMDNNRWRAKNWVELRKEYQFFARNGAK